MGTKLGMVIALLRTLFSSRFVKADISSPTIDSQYFPEGVRPGSIHILHDQAGSGEVASGALALIPPVPKAKGHPLQNISVRIGAGVVGD